MKPRIRVGTNDYFSWVNNKRIKYSLKIQAEIEKGIDLANTYFKKNSIKAKAYKPIRVTVK